MFLKLFTLILVSLSFPFFHILPVFARDTNTFVTIINPIRGRDTWVDQSISALDMHLQSTEKRRLPATYLLQYDALIDKEIVSHMKSLNKQNELGLFLEVSEKLANDAYVPYLQGNGDWARPDKVFLSGYHIDQREKMLDLMFSKFQEIFGHFPSSVGAWYIDAQSMQYINSKYHVIAALTVSDQYTTDKYHIWGTYWSVPFYPSKYNTLTPAQTVQNKLNVVDIQWALRDPISAYGDSPLASTYSLQANDYHGPDHKLDTTYFSWLSSIYSHHPENQFGQITVGLEVGSDTSSTREYDKQIAFISDQYANSDMKVVTMDAFAKWYQNEFPALSPPHLLYSENKSTHTSSWWYMNPAYRANIILSDNKLTIRDLRKYNELFTEKDYVLPDKRTILYRTIPAEIDGLVLKNEKPIAGHVSNVKVEQVNDELKFLITAEGGNELVLTLGKENIFMNNKPFLSYSSHSDSILRSLQKALIPLLIVIDSLQNKYPLLLFSTIADRHVVGLPVTNEKILGVKTNPIELGLFTFPFETLSYFKKFPNFPLEKLFISDSAYEAQQKLKLFPQAELISRESFTLESIASKQKSGFRRMLENSEYSIWTNSPIDVN